MPSTFTDALGLEKQVTGEQDNLWGTNLNTLFDQIDDAVGAVLSKSVAGSSDITLTSTEALHATQIYTGVLTGNINVIMPAKHRKWLVFNNTSGAFTLTVKTSAGTGIVVIQGVKAELYGDGTNVETMDFYGAGGTDVPVADGGTGVSTLTDGGVLLGSGTGPITAMAVLADGEFIVGNGTTDPVAESGATARTSLGVAIGTDIQAFDAVLDDIAALSVVADNEVIVGTGAGTYAHESGGTLRTSLGLAIGTDVQAQDAELAAIAGLTSAADRLPYFTGLGTAALATFTGAGRALIDDANAAAQRTTLGLVIGTDVQADLAVPSQAEAEAGTATTERVWTAQRVGQTSAIKTGTYTGNGTTSQAITGIGFQPKYVMISSRETVDAASLGLVWTSDQIVDDNAAGGAILQASGGAVTFETNRIISLGSDGFTVDDGGADEAPNANTIVYNYIAMR